jgi:N-acetylmuramic acid 6-phosphate etherase
MNKIWSPENERNVETKNINRWTTRQILAYGADELLKIHKAVMSALDACETAAELIALKASSGGRIVTIGAGGSGVAGMSVMRELPQNHEALSPEQFTYRVSGGAHIFEPLGCEEVEDDFSEGVREADDLRLGKNDVAILISATGRTPYTRGAARQARKRGALTIGIVCCRGELLEEVDIPVFLDTGPETFVGATCEMSATAQKHALDMIMNAVVVRLGITDGNICHARLVHEKARIRQEFFASGNR